MRKQFLLTIAFVISLPVLSQGIKDSPVAIATPKGIWVYLGNEIPKGFEYQVSKKEGNGSFKQLATIKFNSDLKEFRSKMALYHNYFSDLDAPVEKELFRIQEYALHHRTTDSLFIENLTATHLLTGTAFFDPDVKEGISYQYQVIKTRSGAGIKSSNLVQLPAKINILKPSFKIKQELADQVVLQWYVTQQRNLGTFALFRRVFGTGEFTKIGTKKGYNAIHDTIYMFVADTTVNNPGYYEYYLKPMDVYGNPGPVSDIVSAGPMADPSITVPRYFKARGNDRNHEINLSWKFGNSRYLRGIEIYRSHYYDSGFVKISQLPPTDTTYIDVVPVANENYYYYLQIQGPFGKTYPSAKISAMFKKAGEEPLPPADVEAITVPGGIKIYWSYTEPFIKGFFVFRYVYEKASYEQVSGLITEGGPIYSFIDSSASLMGNQDYRYAIKAVNDVEQISDLSTSASARPGISASVETPMNLKANPKANSVLLIWDDLSKTEQNLMGYKVYRKEIHDQYYAVLPNDTISRNKNYFSDSTVTEGKNYVYAISAVDFYGNESVKSLPAYYSKEQSFVNPPSLLRAVNTDEGILIVWGQLADKNISACKIYRDSETGNTILIATVKPEDDQYLDKSVLDGHLYTYRISLVTGKNLESSKSSAISLRRSSNK